jgi:phage shock protein A
MVLARAEEAKGQAEIANAQTKQQQVQLEAQVKMGELQVKQAQLKIDAFEAETDRFKAQIAEAEARANIQGKGASAAKDLSEAQAQDIENDMAMSGIRDLVGAVSGMGAASGLA